MSKNKRQERLSPQKHLHFGSALSTDGSLRQSSTWTPLSEMKGQTPVLTDNLTACWVETQLSPQFPLPFTEQNGHRLFIQVSDILKYKTNFFKINFRSQCLLSKSYGVAWELTSHLFSLPGNPVSGHSLAITSLNGMAVLNPLSLSNSVRTAQCPVFSQEGKKWFYVRKSHQLHWKLNLLL